MKRSRFEIRGWHVMAALLAFFGAVIAVNATFIAFAVQTFPGEDVRRSYLQGLQYNDTLAERRAQEMLGWQANVDLRPGDSSAVLDITLRTRDGTPIDGAALSGELQWPTDARLDRAVAFQQHGAGRDSARLDDLPAGRWRLRARAERGDGALDFESELTWRSSR